MIPLRERNKQRTKESILAAAFSLFEEKGYDQTTMDMIAEKAEVSRATLFNYFATKDRLLLIFAQQILESKTLPQMMAYLQTAPTVFEAFRFLFMSFYEQILILPDMGRVIKQEIFVQPVSPSLQPQADDGAKIEAIEVILAYGQERGEIRVDIPLDKQANYIGALYLSSFFGFVFPISSTEYEQEIDTLLLFIANGIKVETQPRP